MAMVKKDLHKFLRRTLGERWRFTAALIISMCIHMAIYLSYTPTYEDVKDNAIEFELVEGADQQPLAPDANGPRVSTPEPPDETSPPETPEDLPPKDTPPDDRGTIVGDTDLKKDSAGDHVDSETDIPADTTDTQTGMDTATDSQTAPDTDSQADSATFEDSESQTETGLTADTNSDSDSDTRDSDTEADTPAPAIRIARSGMDTDTDTRADTATGSVAVMDTESGTDTGVKGNRFPKSAGADRGDDAICLHDVFEYAKANPSWMAWLSMQAFAGTRYERGLSSILKSFYYYNEMVSATEINPMTELEGVLISADNFAEFDSYQVVATYNVGQTVLQNRLQKNMGGKAGFSMVPTAQGVSAIDANSFRWDLVGSGRVMVASDAKKGALNPKWPKNVTCMKSRPPFTGDAQKAFDKLVRASLGPQTDTDRWPVIVLATRDPDAAGMTYKPVLKKNFRWAIIKGYFSEPIQITGEVKFTNDPAVMQQVEKEAKGLIAYASNNVGVKFMKFDKVLQNIRYEVDGDTLRFTAPMTQNQADVLFTGIYLYSGALNKALMAQ